MTNIGSGGTGARKLTWTMETDMDMNFDILYIRYRIVPNLPILSYFYIGINLNVDIVPNMYKRIKDLSSDKIISDVGLKRRMYGFPETEFFCFVRNEISAKFAEISFAEDIFRFGEISSKNLAK
jgi:hypothetical protein